MKQSKYISGIYNYCDRWCERCPMRFRCFLYAKEQKRVAKHKAKGEDPHDWNVVMQDIKEDFAETKKLLDKKAKELEIDLNVLPQEEYKKHDPADHPLMKITNTYFKLAHKFLKKLRAVLNKERRELIKNAAIISPTHNDVEMLRKLISNYETITWYHTLIPVKIHRALDGKMEAETDEFAQRDVDGSAKVAYIGITKSMNALKAIYEWNEELKDFTLTLLAEAEKLHKGVDREFPGHRTFKRPGFDN